MSRVLQVMHAYPGVMAHALEVARSLEERGWLYRHLASVAYLPNSAFDRTGAALLKALGLSRVVTELQRRRELDLLHPARVYRQVLPEMARLAVGRLGLGAVAVDRVWEMRTLSFDRWVASHLRRGLDAVIGYEHSCRATFRRARRLGIATVYEMVAPHYSVSHLLIRAEVQKFPGLSDRYSRHVDALERRRNRHKDTECDLTDFYVANSRFTAASAMARGVPPERIAVVPLACPRVVAEECAPPRRGPLTFLYAGAISIRKGAHLLLDAWKRLAPGPAQLRIAGGWQLPDSYRQQVAGNLSHLGLLTREALYREYLGADVLVFPTLCDGWGMVVSEALAHGLPVLMTIAAGAADLIREKENGLLVAPADGEALATAMTWCLEHPDQLRAMRPAARQTAAARPWSVFRREYAESLVRLLERHPT